jgi:polyphosphate glucokinase
MLFLGFGTGLGSSLIVDGIVEPMELGHLPYKKGTYEDYVGNEALQKHGKKKWRKHVADVVTRLIAALEPDEVVLGGGNAKELKELPPKCKEQTTGKDDAHGSTGSSDQEESSSQTPGVEGPRSSL